MEPKHSQLHGSVDRIGKIIDKHVNVFHIETALNNRMFEGPMGFLGKREEDFTDLDRTSLAALRWTLGKTPRALRQQIFQRVPAGYGLIACAAGRTEPTHEKILAACRKQLFVSVKGQADILIAGIPYISPYNVGAVLNPLLVQVMAQGYFFNMYRGVPLIKKGGTLIVTHPCIGRVRSGAAPELHRVLPPPVARDPRRAGAAQEVREGVRGEPQLRRSSTARATPTTAPTRSTCGTGARTAASTWAR